MTWHKKLKFYFDEILKSKPNFWQRLIIQIIFVWIIPMACISFFLYYYASYTIPHRLEIREKQIERL